MLILIVWQLIKNNNITEISFVFYQMDNIAKWVLATSLLLCAVWSHILLGKYKFLQILHMIVTQSESAQKDKRFFTNKSF